MTMCSLNCRYLQCRVALFVTLSVLFSSPRSVNANTNVKTELLRTFASAKILWSGVMKVLDKDYLYFFTDDIPPKVYEFPIDRFKADRLDTYGVTSTDIKHRWPSIGITRMYTQCLAKEKMYSAALIQLSGSLKLMFVYGIDDANSEYQIDTLMWTLNPEMTTVENFTTSLFFIKGLPNVKLLSSPEADLLYTICELDYDVNSKYIHTFKIGNHRWDDTTDHMHICQKPSSKISIMKEDNECEWAPWLQTINGGFVYQNNYYMYNSDSMFIFDQSAMQYIGTDVQLKVVRLEDFLLYSETTFATVATTTTTTTSTASYDSNDSNGSNSTETESKENSSWSIVVILIVVISIAFIAMASVTLYLICKGCESKPKPIRKPSSRGKLRMTSRETKQSLQTSMLKQSASKWSIQSGKQLKNSIRCQESGQMLIKCSTKRSVATGKGKLTRKAS